VGDGSRTATQLATYYGMSPLYGMGDEGSGVTIGLFELEPYTQSDISTYESCYGISTPVSETNVDGGVTAGTGQSGEAALDIEDAAGLAPASSIHVYEGPNTDQGVYDTYAAMINDDTAQVISTSWGECEPGAASSQDVMEPGATQPTYLFLAEQDLFEQAVVQGQTVLAAAGDTGSTDCRDTDGDPLNELTVDDPGSQPFVLSVGGTSISGSSQSVWNDSAEGEGAGGGGISGLWCMPQYQYETAIPGLINSESQTDTTDCGTTEKGFIREVPDVSADADPETGYVVYFTGGASDEPTGWQIIGGTSAAAPLWAAVAALTDASPFCKDYGSGPAGVQAYALYQIADINPAYFYSSHPEVFTDIKSGNNDYGPSGYAGGLYPATTGYDMASGLGTPLVSGRTAVGAPSTFYPGLAAVMCQAFATKLTSVKVTGISPSRGPLRAQKVTVTGSGFLPIAGADMAEVGSSVVSASCSSTTKCTVTIPRHAAGTVNIRISAEDSAYTAINTKDRFQYVAAPKTRSISPNHGPARGGTRVTIRGSSFVGVTAVHFGSKKGTKIRVVSSTEIIVTAPKGAGTVKVTVTAAGGTTAGSIKFRY
jgi:subtilase family serine protease